ncbi:unnamed protein product [Lactuca saligna]|uniref:Uncharacterized protein n=1 Tax=Lactuca saligna TaxID=75948 RepID=A0AA35YUA6_LACSI|nr:unnamed protein product [Lactuca saligna]
MNSNKALTSPIMEQCPSAYMDDQGMNIKNQIEIKWALGLQDGFNRMTSNEALTSPIMEQHSSTYMDYQGMNIRDQSRAHPHEIVTVVRKALQELNVCWKK